MISIRKQGLLLFYIVNFNSFINIKHLCKEIWQIMY